MNPSDSTVRRLIAMGMSLWLGGLACLLTCVSLLNAAVPVPTTPALAPATNSVANHDDPGAAMPCHGSKSQTPKHKDSAPNFPSMKCCVADALPATFAKALAPPVLQAAFLPHYTVGVTKFESFAVAAAFDLPPPLLAGTDTYLLISLLLI